MRPVVLVSFNSGWNQQFQDASRELRTACGANMVSIHHVGSTAIPGMPAKPVIDMMLVVARLEDADDIVPNLIEMGYEARGEYGMPGRRYFVKDVTGQPKLHVHAFQVDHPAIARHLAFRDYLIAHPEEAQRYADLKMELAGRFRNDRSKYVDGKASLISELERRALAWRSG